MAAIRRVSEKNKDPVKTTLTSQKISGATSISVSNLEGWHAGASERDKVPFVMYIVDSKGELVAGSQTSWFGNVSKNSLTIENLVLTGGQDQLYPIGAKVVASPTAAWANELVEALLESHHEDGRPKKESIEDNSIEGKKIKDNTVDGSKLKNDSIGSTKLKSQSITPDKVDYAQFVKVHNFNEQRGLALPSDWKEKDVPGTEFDFNVIQGAIYEVVGYASYISNGNIPGGEMSLKVKFDDQEVALATYAGNILNSAKVSSGVYTAQSSKAVKVKLVIGNYQSRTVDVYKGHILIRRIG